MKNLSVVKTNWPCMELSELRSVSDVPGFKSTDLVVQDTYEGGASVWECANDLAEYLSHCTELKELRDFSVLELGCGSAIPTISVFENRKGMRTYGVVQDLNRDVLRNTTYPAVSESLGSDIVEKCMEFVGCSWDELLTPCSGISFDLLLASECIYRVKHYSTLLDIMDTFANHKGKMLIATKRYYFGVGGGTYQFIDYVKHNRPTMSVNILQTFNDGKSSIRDIIEVKRAIN